MNQDQFNQTIDLIRTYHRQERFMVKMQSRIDRSMEAYVRVYVFGFNPMLDEKARKEITKKTTALMKECRAGTAADDYADIAEMVLLSDKSSMVWENERKKRIKAMEKLASQLPTNVVAHVEETRGAGLKGLAQIIGEAGAPLYPNFSNPAKLWKRLGLAPFDGLAMSSWMRDSWRPRKLSSEEWIANPFNRERYALVRQIAESLFKNQGIGKDKAESGVWTPDGPYGEVYAERHARTKETHPDWSDGHRMSDALRFMIKRYVRNLWRAWRDAVLSQDAAGHSVDDTQTRIAGGDNSDTLGQHTSVTHRHAVERNGAAGQGPYDTQENGASRTNHSETLGQKPCDTQTSVAESAAGHRRSGSQSAPTGRTKKRTSSADKETRHLLRSPANAAALAESIADLEAGRGVKRTT